MKNKEELQRRIEDYLNTRDEWVSAAELSYHFGVKERELRGDDGLIVGIAISGDKGYRSLSKCSDIEFIAYENRIHAHAVKELERIHNMRMKRNFEKDAQQQLALPL